MAKDPRFNFYPDNWSGGTKRMTFEQKGAYMELLLLNFYCFSDGLPGFTQTEALSSLGTAAAYAELWKFLMPKFQTDGIYFWSARMQKEFQKSKKHSEHQTDRANKRWNPDPVLPRHMPVNGTGIGNGTERDLNKKESPQNFKMPDVDGDELVFPLDTKPVRELWAAWKKKRWEKYNLRYGMMSEQADLKRLEGLNFHQIQETILAAISGEWKNLYPDKGQGNGKTNSGTNKKQQHTANVAQHVAEHYASKLAGGPGNPDGKGPDGK